MTKKSKTTLGWLALVFGIVVMCPFPTRIAQPLKVEFSGGISLLEGLRVSQSWETYGLFGGGREVVMADSSGHASLPARFAYGSIATRTLARAITYIAIHSSYGARVTVEFTLPPSVEVRFAHPSFSLHPSGTYRDADLRVYFPQVSERGQRVIVSGDFNAGDPTLRFLIENIKPSPAAEPIPARGSL